MGKLVTKIIFRFALLAACVLAAFLLLLSFPQPLFSYSLRVDNLVLHSDRPIPSLSAQNVLKLAQDKLAKSPLYSNREVYDIFVCNAAWRQALLFNKDYGAGGVALYPLSSNIFLRDSWIEQNRLISPLGTPVAADRTLDYFIAHEITHQATGKAIGPIRFLKLPQYIREGYADYVGKGSSLNYDEAKRAFLAGAPEMDYKKSGLYLRYHLLVAYLLDHQGWTVSRLLRDCPPQQAVENSVKQERRP